MPATAVTPATSRRSGSGGARSFSPGKGARPASPPRAGGVGGGSGGLGKTRPTTDDHEILFQRFFKSVGPRTYAAQVRRATNGNHYLVLMEGKRDDKTGEVRKTRLFLYSEDFVEFFRLVKSTAEFVKANPVPEAIRLKRQKFWARDAASVPGASPSPAQPPVPRAVQPTPRAGPPHLQ